jgi:hypothetical protein
MPREMLCRIGDLARLLLPAPYEPDVARTAYAPRATITHRIDVFRFARQKRDAFAAHRRQISRCPDRCASWAASLGVSSSLAHTQSPGCTLEALLAETAFIPANVPYLY